MAEERTEGQTHRPVLTALEASLLLLGVSFLLLWATSGGATIEPDGPVRAWALRMHGMPLFLLAGTCLIAWRFRPLLPPLCPDARAGDYAISAACLGAVGGMLIGPSDPKDLAPMLEHHTAVLWGLAWVGVAAPIIEELFYRGALQGALARQAGPALGAVGSALAFGLAHTGQPAPLLFFGLGGAFAAYRAGSRALLPPILAHVGWNVATVARSTAHAPPVMIVLFPAVVGIAALLLAWLRHPTAEEAP